MAPRKLLPLVRFAVAYRAPHSAITRSPSTQRLASLYSTRGLHQSPGDPPSLHQTRRKWITVTLVAAASAGVFLLRDRGATTTHDFPTMGQPDPALPTFSWEQVQSHANSSNANKKTWVVFKHGVYDITDFASTHPGGGKVMQAAGKSIELFYQQSEPHTRAGVPKTLEELRIGNLRDQDVLMLEEAKRIAQSQSPSTSGVDRSIAAASPPLEQFFFVESASPSPVPNVEAGAFGLKIIDLRGLQGEEAVSLSLTDLKTRFKQHSVITTIRCATPRTSDGTTTSSRVPAKWTGVLLADVLVSVGLTTAEDIQQIRFEALDTDAQGRAFGSSIPATTALNAENGVLLAFEMDGASIPREHGFPLRVIVPGTTGSKNVKFVHRIIVG